MARILIADTHDGAANLERILGPEHERVIATTTESAVRALETGEFDLIIVGVHFDESRMFELVKRIPRSGQNADKPVICFCSRDTEMTRLMHDSLEISSRAFGAWMYVDQHKYNVLRDPDAEIKRVLERCLTQGQRQSTQLARFDIQQRRHEIYELRSKLLAEEWSPELENRLGDLRQKLAAILLELSNLHKTNVAQQESVAESRGLKDRVAEHVFTDEESFDHEERKLVLSEAEQSALEQALINQEEEKGKTGRDKFFHGPDISQPPGHPT